LRKILLMATLFLSICAVVYAAEKLSEKARQKVAGVEKELRERVGRKPLSINELVRIESVRLQLEKFEEDEKEKDPLGSLYVLRRQLHNRIRELNPYWKPEREPKSRKRYIQKMYNISDIVTYPPDRPAPMIGFGYGPYLDRTTTRSIGGGIIDLAGGDEYDSSTGFDWEKIQEMISRILGDEDESTIMYSGGKMHCNITEEQAAKIEAFLGQIRLHCGHTVNLEVKFLRTSEKYLAELSRMSGGKNHLSDEAEKKLLGDVIAKKDVEIVASSEIIAANNQIVHIREGQQLSFLMDYDINTVGIPTLQPVVRLVNEGLICQFKPIVLQEGKMVFVDILATFSKIRKNIRKGQFFGGELVFPVMDMARLRTSVEIPAGSAILAGGNAVSSGRENEEPHEFVVYLKPTVSRGGE